MGELRGPMPSYRALLARPSDLKPNPDCADIAMVPATGTEARQSPVGSMDTAKEFEGGANAPEPVLDAPVGEDAEAEEAEEEANRRRALLSTYAYTASLGLAAIALVWRGPLHGAAPIRELIPQPEMFVVVCVLWAAAIWAPVSLHYGGNSYIVMLGEIPVLLGLAFLSPNLLVLGVVCGELSVLLRSRRPPLVKLAFNVTAEALCMALIVLVYRELLGSHSPVSLRGWAAAAAALATQTVFSRVTLWIVMKLYGQTPERGNATQITTQAALMLASICLSFVVLDAAWFSLWAMVPLVLVAGLIIAAYRGYVRLSSRFTSVQRLYDFSRALNRASLEPSSVRVDVLQQVRSVMRARRAELVLAEPSKIPRRISVDDRGPSGFEATPLDESSIITQAIDTCKASLHSNSGQAGHVEHDAIVGLYREAVVAPLMKEDVVIGAIVALDRNEEQDSFDSEDLQVLETLAAHAVTSLQRADLFESLEHQRDDNRYQATHDALTKLPNRHLFRDRAETALRESQGVAIVLLDIDRFKEVNDTLGHTIGDHLLKEVSERLVRAAAGRATVARLGGDEFALIIPDVNEPQQAIEIVNDLFVEMCRPFRMEGLALAVSASAGIAVAPEHGDDEATLLQRADIAMYLAKERRSRVELYSGEHDRAMARRVELGRQLEHALKTRREFSVMYQPIADVRSGQVARVEALVRWNNSIHGAISPEEFIGIAEQTGLINQISDFVLAEACAQLARWRQAGLRIGLAINLSGHEFSDPRLVDRIAKHLRAHDLQPAMLSLEVTETAVMSDLAQVRVVLDELDALGIEIAIDDYGTGYSSLAYIHQLPVRELKIDRSFVTNLANESSNRIIVQSSIAMAHSLGLKVVAEGAEDAVTCAVLADLDCDFIQGYHLSRPMTSSQLQSWLLQGVSFEFAAFREDLPIAGDLALRAVAS
jgi:diguanylate cyclase (GGDEF)-like protein